MSAIAIPLPRESSGKPWWLLIPLGLLLSFFNTTIVMKGPTEPVEGADWFVDGSCANDGDGTSSSCAASPGGVGAWNDLPYTNAKCTSMGGGDIVQMADNGEFDYEAPNQNNGYDWDTACDGSAGNHIVFRNAPGDIITITGFLDDSGDTWTSAGNGEYSCTTCGRDHPNRPAWHAWYADGGGMVEVNYSAQTRSTYTCGDGSLADNEVFMDSDGTICVQLPGDASPADMDYFRIPHARIVVDMSDLSYVTWQRHPSDSGQPIRIWGGQAYAVSTPGSSGPFTFDGVELAYVEDRCVNNTSAPTQQDLALRFLNSKIYNCGQEGIRIDSRDSTDTLVQDTEIYNIQHAAMFPVCSGTGDCPDNNNGSDNATGIRLAKSSNVQVHDVTMYNVGGGLENNNVARGIDFESDAVITPQSACADCVVDGFYLYDSAPGAMYAIHVGGGETRALGTTIVRNSRFNNVDDCLRLASGTYSGTLKWVNNACLDFQSQGVDGNTVNGSLALIIRNSVYESDINPSSDVIELADPDTTLTFENNALYAPNAGASDVAVNDGGTDYLFDAGCTDGVDCIQDLDPSSDDTACTLLETKGTYATDLTLQSTGSNCYEAGVADADVTLDFLNSSRSDPPDIGAHEY